MEFWAGTIIEKRGNVMCKINVEEKIAIYARVALHQNNNLEKQIDKIKLIKSKKRLEVIAVMFMLKLPVDLKRQERGGKSGSGCLTI